MTKYFKLLMVAIFATMSFALTGCGDDDDDEPDAPNSSASFNYNGEKLYVRDSGTLDNVQVDGQMQCAFALYQTANPYSGEELDIYPKVSVTLELKPFDVETASKGTKLDVVTSRYTWIEDYTKGFSIGTSSVEGVEYYFKPTAGEVTFVGYDSKNETVTLKVNLTMSNPSKSVSLNGTVNCKYEENSYTLSEYGGGDYPY